MSEKKVSQSSGYDDETLTKLVGVNQKKLRADSGVRVYKVSGKWIISGRVPAQHYGDLKVGDEFLVEGTGSNWSDAKRIF